AGLVSAFVGRAGADAVDRAVEADMRRHPIPGLALEIIRNGKCVKRAGYGLANLEWQTPVTPRTVFEIGSITKQFTAAGILLLAQDGRLSLDDRITQYLKTAPAAWSNITLRHLLTHTSGLKSYTGLAGFELTRHLTEEQFVRDIAAQPREFAPGEAWKYCNTGFNLLGYVIEHVSEKNYWDFMSER